MPKLRRRFSLVEVLIITGVAAAFAAVAVVAANPAHQFNKAMEAQRLNLQRWSDVNAIADAVYQYANDKAAFPDTIAAAAGEICRTGAGDCSSLIDLSALTANGAYLVSMPVDPHCPAACAANGTGYTIVKDTDNDIVVTAPNAEFGATINTARRYGAQH